MAANMTNDEFASSARKRLTYLNCDFIKGMEDEAIAELILTPGHGRFYILQWLLSRYDPKLSILLQENPSTSNEAILKKLVVAARSMCLCRPNDVDLIKGEGPISKQKIFIDKLLTLVCAKEKKYSQDVSFKGLADCGAPLTQRHRYMEAVVGQEGFQYMLEDGIDLVPPDLRPEVEREWARSGWAKDSDKWPVPSLEELLSQSQELSVELEKNNLTLARLKEEITVQDEKQYGEVKSLNHVLCLSLLELSQLSDGFCQCYQASKARWARQPPPELSDLGPAFHRVHTKLSKFNKLLEDLDAIRYHSSQLEEKIQDGKPGDQSQSLVPLTKQVTRNFESCMSVMEEALFRSASDFKPREARLLL